MPVRFQTFSTSIRPLRVAVLTNVDDADWHSTCLSIIEFFTKLWGGGHAIIVPTDGRTIDDTFWALLSAHDPDIILPYQKTGEDLRRSQPSQFEEAVSKSMTGESQDAWGTEQREAAIRSSLSRSVTDRFGVNDGLLSELLIRLAPFSFQRKPSPPGHVWAGHSPSHPLTSTLDVLDQESQPHSVVEVENETTIPPLWLAAAVGWSTSEYLESLRTRGLISVSPLKAGPKDESEVISWGMPGTRPFSGETLFDLAQLGLTHARSRFARTFELPTIAVLGDSVRDFCLYYGLLRLHARAMWVPSWFFEDNDGFQGRLHSVLSVAAELGRLSYSTSCVMISASISRSEIEKIAQFASSISYTNLSAEALSPTFVANLVRYPIRVYAKGAIDRLSTLQLSEDELPGPFESLRPLGFGNLNPQKHRWVVEVGFRRHRIPRHPALGTFVVEDPNLGETSVRVCEEGAAYICPGQLVVGEDIDFNLVRPTVRVPTARDIFHRVLDYCGYDCEVSDKGRYASETIEKLGGIEAAGAVFRNPQRKAVLEKFLDTSAPGKGVFDEGVYLKDRRRYLNFSAIAKILGSAASSTEVIDDLISRKVFYRGFVLQCNQCSAVAWFSVDDITHTFTCGRCGKNQQYTQSSWKHPDEPAWFYKLDEIVYLALGNNSFVPILTLDALRTGCKESFLFCPELRVWPDGESKHFMELDICCIPDGRLCIGEAKSNGTLETSGISADNIAHRYLAMASKLCARTVVFSTSKTSWDEASETAIDSVFGGSPHVTVLKWTAKDL